MLENGEDLIQRYSLGISSFELCFCCVSLDFEIQVVVYGEESWKQAGWKLNFCSFLRWCFLGRLGCKLGF